MSKRVRLTQRKKEAKAYDNVDAMSLNNPFVDPDHEQYDISGSSNWFDELPDMGTEWQKDIGAYDEESNFLMPLDDAPASLGSPKMAKKMANIKAKGCIKIAEALFPDGVDEFVDAQAADFMNLSDEVVVATLRRIADYTEEPAKVASFLEKKANEEDLIRDLEAALNDPAAEDALEDDGVSEEDLEELEEATDEVTEDLDEEDALEEDLESDEDDISFEDDEGGDISFDDEGLEGEEFKEASVNPSTEFDDFFSNDGNIQDIHFGNDVANESVIASVFSDAHVDQGNLRKSASVKRSKTASRNLKLSEKMGNVVPQSTQATGLESLWESAPNVSSCFE